MTDANPHAKDFGEPWAIIKNESISPAFRTLKDRNGACPQEAMERAVSCVNACSGLTDAQLANVKKAVLAWEIYEAHGYYNEEDGLFLLDGIGKNWETQFVASDGVSLTMDKLITAAKELRKKDADFRELNKLIDEV